MYLQELLYGLRQMRKNPGFTLIAVTTLAVGIGMTATMFAIIYAVLLRPLPFARGEELVLIGPANNTGDLPLPSSYLSINDWRAQSRSLQDVAHWELWFTNMEGNGVTKSVTAVQCSPNLFSMLQVNPILGRTFSSRDDSGELSGVAVLSSKLWKTMYFSDPQVINRGLVLGGNHYTVIGVMPDSFIFPFAQEGMAIWIPAQPKKEWADRNWASLQVIGRLKSGVSIETAQSELSTISNALASKDNKVNILVKDYRESLVGNARSILLTLATAVIVVWLIACINVINLLFTRAISRRREVAIRAAIGASKWQLLRQYFVDGVLLAGAACTLGIIFSLITMRAIQYYIESRLPYAHTIEFNLPTFGIALMFSVISALLFGILPALYAYRTIPQEALHGGSLEAGASRLQRRLLDGIVVCEVALSLVLLLDAGLLARTISTINATPLGYVPERLVVAQMLFPQELHPGADIVQSLYQPLVQRLRQTPGIKDAAITTALPMNQFSSFGMPVQILGRPIPKGNKPDTAEVRIMSPELYQTLGIRLLKGRSFTNADSKSSPWAVIVNQAFLRKHFPGEDPLGKRVRTAANGPHTYSEIVGVVDDTYQKSLTIPVEPEINLCYTQIGQGDDLGLILGRMVQVVVRTEGEPEDIIPTFRTILQEASPRSMQNISTMQTLLEQSLGDRVLVAGVVWIFAGAALLIVVIGLYGLLIYNVKQSIRNIAIRLSLGANRSNIVMMIVRHALLVLGIGTMAGYIVWMQTVSVIQGYLYGVKPYDLLTYFSVASALLVVGVLASYMPARQASSVDPMNILRQG